MPRNPDIERLNPCLKEHNLTLKCFNDNNYDKAKCDLQMSNYNECKKFWGNIRDERRRKGITPYLPPVEERENIKADYFKQL